MLPAFIATDLQSNKDGEDEESVNHEGNDDGDDDG